MRSFVGRISTLALLVVSGVSTGAQAQPVSRRPLPQVGRGVAVRRERIAERRAVMRAEVRAAAAGPRAARVARARMIARRAVIRDRIRNMTPAQRQQLKTSRQALRVERQRIGEQLRNGSITREQGRQQMLNWRREHRPNLGLRGPRRPGGGEF